jgi:RimJ/RimL family protein N-acetyltransferase
MSLRYVYEQDVTIARFVAAMIPTVGWRGFDNCRTIGVIDASGNLIAGIVYNNWNPMSGIIEVNAAAIPGSKWVTRETLHRMSAYAFEKCACQMAVMRVRESDDRLLRQLAAYGFTFVRIARLFGRDADGVYCSLTVEDWANNKFNKRPEPRVVEQLLDAPVPEWLRRKEAA